jgi:hypothetical protein
MKPANRYTVLECRRDDCQWRYVLDPAHDNADEISRYHAIQVHNDLEAVNVGRF